MFFTNYMKYNILEDLKQELLSRGSFDTFPEGVWKMVSTLNTYGTNAIEGNTLTQDEVERVVIERLGVERSIDDVLVTIQHASAFRGLIARRARAIDLVTILELHEEIFKGVMPDAGQWRRTRVFVRGASLIPPPPEKVVSSMEVLMREYDRRELASEEAIALGAWLHHGFESIHPFSDGNGRVGRLLLNLHLLKHNWPPISVMPVDRDKYLEALDSANEGDLRPFIEYSKIIMASSLLTFLSLVGTSVDELRPLADLESEAGYSAKYLTLRAGQGELPATRVGKGWRTSRRALDLYNRKVAR